MRAVPEAGVARAVVIDPRPFGDINKQAAVLLREVAIDHAEPLAIEGGVQRVRSAENRRCAETLHALDQLAHILKEVGQRGRNGVVLANIDQGIGSGAVAVRKHAQCGGVGPQPGDIVGRLVP